MTEHPNMMTDTERIGALIVVELDKHRVGIDRFRIQRIARKFVQYLDIVEFNGTQQRVIDEIDTPSISTSSGHNSVVCEMSDVECECNTPFAETNRECPCCFDDFRGDMDLIQLYLLPVVRRLLVDSQEDN